MRALTIEFLKPALMDDELCVETHPSAIRGAPIDMTQKIRRGGEVLLAPKVRIAIVAGGKARRIPAGILAKLKASSAFKVALKHNGNGVLTLIEANFRTLSIPRVLASGASHGRGSGT